MGWSRRPKKGQSEGRQGWSSYDGVPRKRAPILLAPQRHYSTPKALSNHGPKASTVCKIYSIATVRPPRIGPKVDLIAHGQHLLPHASQRPCQGSHSSQYFNVIRLTLGPVDVKPVTGRIAPRFDLWR